MTCDAEFIRGVYFIKVFDATNTTRERRSVIVSFAREKGYKASEHVAFINA